MRSMASTTVCSNCAFLVAMAMFSQRACTATRPTVASDMITVSVQMSLLLVMAVWGLFHPKGQCALDAAGLHPDGGLHLPGLL